MKKLNYNVLYLTNIPSPYMIGYLNELNKYVTLEVVFEKGADSSRPDSWNKSIKGCAFKYTILNGKAISAKVYGDVVGSAPDDKAVSFGVIKYLKKSYDLIIVANPCTPTGIIAITYMRLKNIAYTIQSEGGIPGEGNGFKEKFKYYLMSKAKYYFSTCAMDDSYFYKYGAKKNEIKRYPFASVSEKDLPNKIPAKEERNRMKNELGITSKWFILTVGRSVPVKGFDVLLNCIKHIEESDITIGFIGGECITEYQQIINHNDITNVFFKDNVSFEILTKYYIAADIFVLPTRSDTWGLVVNEAMAFGLPVITTDRCVAGNALIENGINGYIVPSENSSAIAEKINYLLEKEELLKSMSFNNFNVIRSWTFEEMGRVMEKNIKEILETK